MLYELNARGEEKKIEEKKRGAEGGGGGAWRDLKRSL